MLEISNRLEIWTNYNIQVGANATLQVGFMRLG